MNAGRPVARLLLVLAAAALVLGPPSVRAAELPADFEDVPLAEGLTAPTAVDWTPDGTMLVAEKAGRVHAVDPDGSRDPVPVVDISDHVNDYVDRGLLGLAVDADFDSNGFVYLLYTYERGDTRRDTPAPVVSRLTRVALNPDGTLRDPEAPETVLLGSIGAGPCPPAGNDVDCIPADGIGHVIGTVRSDSDGTLWVGSGEATDAGVVQPGAFRSLDEQSMAGKILHVDRSGRGLPGHPFCPGDADLTHVCTKIYAKGFRNPFRFTLREGAGPVVGDVGLNAREEIDLVEPGRSYGWPCYEGTLRTPGYDATPRCADEYAHEGTAAAARPPAYEYPAAGGAAIVMGPRLPAGGFPPSHAGAYVFGDYVRGFLRLFRISGGKLMPEGAPFATGWAGVDLELTPDGRLAYVDFGVWGGAGTGAVRAIAHAPDNKTPLARASGDPAWGAAPLEVKFTGSRSSDPDGDALTYDWDFGDGSPHSSDPNPTHVYTDEGTYVARLTVSDGRGRSARASVRITPGNTPPRVTIESPEDGALFQTWQSVALAGSATDDEDGDLTGAALDWHVVLQHGTHVHDLEHLPGASTTFRPLQSHDADSHYRITLSATDSAGSSSSSTVEIYPEVVPLSLSSSPEGAPLSYGEQSVRAPFETLSAIGFWTSISAAESFRSGSRTYVFDRWSDGGARLHDIIVPDAPLALSAFYREAAEAPATGAGAPALGATGPPRVTAFSVRDRRFAVARRATPTTAARRNRRVPRGTAFRYRLSVPAGVRIAIARIGRRGRQHRVGALVRRSRGAGPNRTRFTGRIGKRALRPGLYVAAIEATDAASRRSERRRARFRIVAP